MKNKKIWLGILVMVFGMTVVGCEKDTWTDTTSLSQLNGTWKGSYTLTEPEENFTGITRKSAVEMIWTVSTKDGKTSTSMKITMTFSGSKLSAYWSDIKENYATSEDVIINDSKHTISMTQTDSWRIYSLNSIDKTQINQNGTKIKMLPEGIICIKQ
jgi:hypothetical protein